MLHKLKCQAVHWVRAAAGYMADSDTGTGTGGGASAAQGCAFGSSCSWWRASSWALVIGEDEDAATTPGSSAAITACRDEMRRQLTPGMSVDFPFMHDIDNVREIGDDAFALRSYVDSEGLDEAPFRYHYDCLTSGGVTAFELR